MGNVMTALRVVTRKRVHREVGSSKRIGDSEILLACILHTLLLVVWRFLQMGNEEQLDNYLPLDDFGLAWLFPSLC